MKYSGVMLESNVYKTTFAHKGIIQNVIFFDVILNFFLKMYRISYYLMNSEDPSVQPSNLHPSIAAYPESSHDGSKLTKRV